MAFACVDDGVAVFAHHLQQALDRLDGRAREREVVAHLVDVAADAAEIGLHVDDDERGVHRRQAAVEGPAVGLGNDEALAHRDTPSSTGAPRRLWRGEHVHTRISKVSTYGTALNR